uniref:Zinc transporter ZIP11 n=1 Tax=Chromera velia CCMP2878 TaxID=1169474 RepID=A0A0G4HFR2_9ALVE|eukprot:Cvel_6648.t1-p1 / transcript=Cvel_6648.t1 / gene=Cvel_6648 / organism=Chromera_velia_CCMP2878 / gene_product=hypothetical protein / transcript_product=hypothetical protein / location=Cvel_scaffold329:92409-97219(+) / protein_length=1176 / sequence_SO=supercontig / SO=protein_coding / is_pseudo=false
MSGSGGDRPLWLQALLYGCLSAASFPVGAALGVLSANIGEVHHKAIACMMAFGAGSLIFAITVELYAEAIEDYEDRERNGGVRLAFSMVSAVVGSLVFVWLKRTVEDLRNSSISEHRVWLQRIFGSSVPTGPSTAAGVPTGLSAESESLLRTPPVPSLFDAPVPVSDERLKCRHPGVDREEGGARGRGGSAVKKEHDEAFRLQSNLSSNRNTGGGGNLFGHTRTPELRAAGGHGAVVRDVSCFSESQRERGRGLSSSSSKVGSFDHPESPFRPRSQSVGRGGGSGGVDRASTGGSLRLNFENHEGGEAVVGEESQFDGLSSPIPANPKVPLSRRFSRSRDALGALGGITTLPLTTQQQQQSASSSPGSDRNGNDVVTADETEREGDHPKKWQLEASASASAPSPVPLSTRIPGPGEAEEGRADEEEEEERTSETGRMQREGRKGEGNESEGDSVGRILGQVEAKVIACEEKLEEKEKEDECVVSRERREESRTLSSVALAMWLGIALDGVPESMLIGFLTNDGDASWAFVISVFVANFPEAFSSAYLMRREGVTMTTIMFMWGSLFVMTGALSALTSAVVPKDLHRGGTGEVVLDVISSSVEGLAGGAMLSMLSSTMLPEAFEQGGDLVGLFCVLGFLSSVLIRVLAYSPPPLSKFLPKVLNHIPPEGFAHAGGRGTHSPPAASEVLSSPARDSSIAWSSASSMGNHYSVLTHRVGGGDGEVMMRETADASSSPNLLSSDPSSLSFFVHWIGHTAFMLLLEGLLCRAADVMAGCLAGLSSSSDSSDHGGHMGVGADDPFSLLDRRSRPPLLSDSEDDEASPEGGGMLRTWPNASTSAWPNSTLLHSDSGAPRIDGEEEHEAEEKEREEWETGAVLPFVISRSEVVKTQAHIHARVGGEGERETVMNSGDLTYPREQHTASLQQSSSRVKETHRHREEEGSVGSGLIRTQKRRRQTTAMGDLEFPSSSSPQPVTPTHPHSSASSTSLSSAPEEEGRNSESVESLLVGTPAVADSSPSPYFSSSSSQQIPTAAVASSSSSSSVSSDPAQRPSHSPTHHPSFPLSLTSSISAWLAALRMRADPLRNSAGNKQESEAEGKGGEENLLAKGPPSPQSSSAWKAPSGVFEDEDIPRRPLHSVTGTVTRRPSNPFFLSAADPREGGTAGRLVTVLPPAPPREG